MLKSTLTAMAASTAALLMLNTQASAETAPDTFEIDVLLADLNSDAGAEGFDNRLKRAVRRYCDGYNPGATRRAARECESDVIEAVSDAIDERRSDIRLAAQS